MADKKHTLTLDLKDGISGNAETAAKALEKLQTKMTADSKALSQLEAAMRRLKKGGVDSGSAFDKLTNQIKKKKEAVAQSQKTLLDYGVAFKPAQKAATQTSGYFKNLFDASTRLPGKLGVISTAAHGLSAPAMALAGATIAVIAAMIALTKVAIKATKALLMFGLASADARRNEQIHLEGITKLRYGYAGFMNRLRGHTDSVSMLQGSIDKVSSSVALGRDRIASYAGELYRAGLRGGNFQAALEGISTVAAVQGEGEASAFKAWAIHAGYAGQSVRKLADDVKARLGGLATKQMLSFTVQVDKARERIRYMFRDINLKPFQKAMSTILELLNEQSSTGRALKTIVDTMFTGFGGALTEATPLIKDFFRGIVLGALHVTSALLTVALWFKRTFGTSTLHDINLTEAAVQAGVLAAYTFAAAVIFVGGQVYLLVKGLQGLISALAKVSDAMAAVYGTVKAKASGTNWSSIGDNIVRGISAGMNAGAPTLAASSAMLANTVDSSFSSAMQIRSPSRRMQERAGYVPEGVSTGIIRNLSVVREASSEMSDAVSFEPKAQPGMMPAISRPVENKTTQSSSFTSGDINITITAPPNTNTDDMAQTVRDAVTNAIQGAAIEMGFAV